jgi:hypothetical protein
MIVTNRQKRPAVADGVKQKSPGYQKPTVVLIVKMLLMMLGLTSSLSGQQTWKFIPM